MSMVFSQRFLLPLLVCLIAPGVVIAQEENDEAAGLPKLEEMELPTKADLLLKPAKDWIVLDQDPQRVIVADPVLPRPGTLESIDKKLEVLRERRTKESGRFSTPEGRQEFQKLWGEAINIKLTLPEIKENPEFLINREEVVEIIHHEDLILRRIDQLLGQGDLRSAYQLLYRLQRKTPDWPGAEKRRQDILFRQAEEELKRDRPFESLVYLEQLDDQIKTADTQPYEGFDELLGQTSERLISEAAEETDHRKARHYLGRLRRVRSNHPVYKKWQQQFENEAEQLMAAADEHTEAGRHDDAVKSLREASRIWPSARNLGSRLRRASERFQVLRVGVLQLPRNPSSYPFPTPADDRERRLTVGTLFQVSQLGITARYRSDFLEGWEPRNLGREATFRLRQTQPPLEPRPALTADQIVDDLAARIDPAHPRYNERLATLIERVSVSSPQEFTVKFRTPPLKVEALLDLPIMATDIEPEPTTEVPGGFGAADEAGDEDEPTVEEVGDEPDAPLVVDNPQVAGGLLSPRFVLHERGPNRNIYRRAMPQPDGLRTYAVAEIVEQFYETPDRAVQGLLRDEVQMIADLPAWLLEPFEEDVRFRVVKQALPETHLIQVNPASEKLKDAELRRAMSYAIDRPRWLREVMLQTDGPLDRGRVVSSPFPNSSSASVRAVREFSYDPTLAFALTFAAKSRIENKQLPSLTMLAPPDARSRAAAEKIVAVWNKLGLDVTLVPKDAEIPESWDLVYRIVSVRDPKTELWPLMAMETTARMEDLTRLPDWLRHELIQLDLAATATEAETRLMNIGRAVLYRGDLIPLWEIDRHTVFREAAVKIELPRNFSGLAVDPVETYQNVERWQVELWYEQSAD